MPAGAASHARASFQSHIPKLAKRRAVPHGLPQDWRRHAAQPLQHRIHLSVDGRARPTRRDRYVSPWVDRHHRRQRRGGKTTLALMACGLLRPDAGTVSPSLFSAYCAQDAKEPPENAVDFALAHDGLAVRLRRELAIEDDWPLALCHALGRAAEATTGGLRPVGRSGRPCHGRAHQPRRCVDPPRHIRCAVALRWDRPSRLARPGAARRPLRAVPVRL